MSKLTIAALTVITFWSTLSLGQTNKFAIGIEQGPNLSFLRGTEIQKDLYKPMVGYSGGLTFQYNLYSWLSIRTNITYERTGGKSVIQAYSGYGNYYISERTTYLNFDYIIAPMLIRLSFGNNFRFFTNVGPYFGYLFKQLEVDDNNSSFPLATYDNTEDYQKNDLGISTGLGATFAINNQLLFTFELRNNLGLYDVQKNTSFFNGSIKQNSKFLLLLSFES